ncbi:protein phosphatase 1 regulatory subunit 35 isoform X2 [Dermochelys coriacea]|uniref:protein phosphatase 1 regulatory subunit 35 isoform X2 n=1 Tax=Dermochelys coriacea TaxID=27794 RepID=UPI001CA8958A|nr:protein phosphatase 1 regulatory subunit 35 isoform X2 [Dermochelys coriacea]
MSSQSGRVTWGLKGMSSASAPGSGFAPSAAPDLTLWAPLTLLRRRDPWRGVELRGGAAAGAPCRGAGGDLSMGAVTATSTFLLLLLLCPIPPLHQFLELTCSPSEWRVTLLALALGHFLLSAFLEVRFLLGSAPDEAPPSPEPSAPRSPAVVAEAPRAKSGLGGAAGDLAAPQLLTSLALGEEVQAAVRQGFDAHRAAQELLATSFLARCSVEGKAAAGMNIPREQLLYQGLVSLRVPAEEVLSCAVQEKRSLVRSQPEPRREPDPEGPDLLMFYEPSELFAETPYLGVEGLPPLRLQPHVRPPASTFLMFRKLQQWEA